MSLAVAAQAGPQRAQQRSSSAPSHTIKLHKDSSSKHKDVTRFRLLSLRAGASTKLRETGFKQERQNINGANYQTEKQPVLHGGRQSLPS